MEKMGHTQYMKNKWKEISFKESRATTRMGYLPLWRWVERELHYPRRVVPCTTAGNLGMK